MANNANIFYVVSGTFFDRYGKGDDEWRPFKVRFSTEEEARKFIRTTRTAVSLLSDEEEEWLENLVLEHVGIVKYNTGMVEPKELYRSEKMFLDFPL